MPNVTKTNRKSRKKSGPKQGSQSNASSNKNAAKNAQKKTSPPKTTPPPRPIPLDVDIVEQVSELNDARADNPDNWPATAHFQTIGSIVVSDTIHENVAAAIEMGKKPENKICCTCVGDCKKSKTCICRRTASLFQDVYKGRQVSTTDGIVLKKEREGNVRFACGPDCQCSKVVPNECDLNVLKDIKKNHRKNFKIIRLRKNKGFILVALRDIKKYTAVVELTGELWEHTEDKMINLYSMNFIEPCSWFKSVIKKARGITKKYKDALEEAHKEITILNCLKKGNCARFVSHGCKANLKIVKVYSGGLSPTDCKIIMVANEDIKAGTELTFNYGPEYKQAWLKNCYCNACESKAEQPTIIPMPSTSQRSTSSAISTVSQNRRAQAKKLAQKKKQNTPVQTKRTPNHAIIRNVASASTPPPAINAVINAPPIRSSSQRTTRSSVTHTVSKNLRSQTKKSAQKKKQNTPAQTKRTPNHAIIRNVAIASTPSPAINAVINAPPIRSTSQQTTRSSVTHTVSKNRRSQAKKSAQKKKQITPTQSKRTPSNNIIRNVVIDSTPSPAINAVINAPPIRSTSQQTTRSSVTHTVSKNLRSQTKKSAQKKKQNTPAQTKRTPNHAIIRNVAIASTPSPAINAVINAPPIRSTSQQTTRSSVTHTVSKNRRSQAKKSAQKKKQITPTQSKRTPSNNIIRNVVIDSTPSPAINAVINAPPIRSTSQQTTRSSVTHTVSKNRRSQAKKSAQKKKQNTPAQTKRTPNHAIIRNIAIASTPSPAINAVINDAPIPPRLPTLPVPNNLINENVGNLEAQLDQPQVRIPGKIVDAKPNVPVDDNKDDSLMGNIIRTCFSWVPGFGGF